MFLAVRRRINLRIRKLMMHHRIGRTAGEEEDPERPGQEADNIHSAIRECHNDWWKEKGMSLSLAHSLHVTCATRHSNLYTSY